MSIRLCHRYHEMCPTKELRNCLHEIPEWPSTTAQDAILRDVVHASGYDVRYNPPVKYKKAFLRLLAKELEQLALVDDTVELSDWLAEEISATMSIPIQPILDTSNQSDITDDNSDGDIVQRSLLVDDENTAYVSYHVPTTNNFVYFRTEKSFNEVGMAIWEAGLLLAELCIAHSASLLTGNIRIYIVVHITYLFSYVMFRQGSR